LNSAFDDIVQLTQRCRFRDCRHRSEPGCAVQAAVEAGELDPGRLRNYLKLDRELSHLAGRRNAQTRRTATQRKKEVFRRMKARER
jgi:ribosome biogenesis GTPase